MISEIIRVVNHKNIIDYTIVNISVDEKKYNNPKKLPTSRHH